MSTTESRPPPSPDVRATDGFEGDSQQVASAAVGRTGWDFLTSTLQSKILLIFGIALVGAIVIWFIWDAVMALPLYAVSSVFFSLLWYQPICNWLSRSSTYIEVWEPETGLLTTYRMGRQVFAELYRGGLQNQVSSRYGNNRIFANKLDLETNELENTWVHECDPWTYHKERRTLNKLTERVSTVFEEIIDGEALAQVEGRMQAMRSMRRHYNDLDKLFFGEEGGGDFAADIQQMETS